MGKPIIVLLADRADDKLTACLKERFTAQVLPLADAGAIGALPPEQRRSIEAVVMDPDGAVEAERAVRAVLPQNALSYYARIDDQVDYRPLARLFDELD